MHRPTVLLRGLLAALMGTLLLAGCATSGSGTQQRLSRYGPDALYERGRSALISNDWSEAVSVFEALNARYSMSAHARQGRVDVIYAYYRLGEKESARDAADTFIRENPVDPRIDYAYYLRGLIDFERTPWALERWLNVDLAERVPQTARDLVEATEEATGPQHAAAPAARNGEANVHRKRPAVNDPNGEDDDRTEEPGLEQQGAKKQHQRALPARSATSVRATAFRSKYVSTASPRRAIASRVAWPLPVRTRIGRAPTAAAARRSLSASPTTGTPSRLVW
jgi:tetratricopeptide (TPR) repeat protein